MGGSGLQVSPEMFPQKCIEVPIASNSVSPTPIQAPYFVDRNFPNHSRSKKYFTPPKESLSVLHFTSNILCVMLQSLCMLIYVITGYCIIS